MRHQVRSQIQRFSGKLGDNRTFAEFTTKPDGNTQLKPFDAKKSHATSLAIAADCAFHLKKPGYKLDTEPNPDQEAPERSTPAK